jgi:hypothetical protein
MSTECKARTLERLEAIAATLRAGNPGRTFIVDCGAVWLRENGKDYGLYSTVIFSDDIVNCVTNGMTVLHRPTPT